MKINDLQSKWTDLFCKVASDPKSFSSRPLVGGPSCHLLSESLLVYKDPQFHNVQEFLSLWIRTLDFTNNFEVGVIMINWCLKRSFLYETQIWHCLMKMIKYFLDKWRSWIISRIETPKYIHCSSHYLWSKQKEIKILSYLKNISWFLACWSFKLWFNIIQSIILST